MIDFEKMEEKALANFNGGEGVFYAKIEDDGHNKILKGRLESGSSIGLHRHETSSEVIFILSGVGTMLLEGEEEILTPGVCHYCKKGCAHTLKNNGQEDLIFYAVVPQQ